MNIESSSIYNAIEDLSGELVNFDMPISDAISELSRLMFENKGNLDDIHDPLEIAISVLQNFPDDDAGKDQVLSILINLTYTHACVSDYLFSGDYNNSFNVIYTCLKSQNDTLVHSAIWLFQHIVNDVDNYNMTYDVVTEIVNKVLNTNDYRIITDSIQFFCTLLNAHKYWANDLVKYDDFWRFVTRYFESGHTGADILFVLKFIFKNADDLSEFEDSYHFVPLLIDLYFKNSAHSGLIFDIIDVFLGSEQTEWTDYIISCGFLSVIRHALDSKNIRLAERATFSVSNMTVNSIDTVYALVDSHVYDKILNPSFVSFVSKDKEAHMNVLLIVGNILYHENNELSQYLLKLNVHNTLINTLFGDQVFTLPIFAMTAKVTSSLMEAEPFDVSFTDEQKHDMKNVIENFNKFSACIDPFV